MQILEYAMENLKFISGHVGSAVKRNFMLLEKKKTGFIDFKVNHINLS